MMSAKPTEPALIRTPCGETKIPEPMMTPTMMATPSMSPISFFSWMLFPEDFLLSVPMYEGPPVILRGLRCDDSSVPVIFQRLHAPAHARTHPVNTHRPRHGALGSPICTHAHTRVGSLLRQLLGSSTRQPLKLINLVLLNSLS